jgi:hypothetical protein
MRLVFCVAVVACASATDAVPGAADVVDADVADVVDQDLAPTEDVDGTVDTFSPVDTAEGDDVALDTEDLVDIGPQPELPYCERFAKASCALQAACPLPGLPVAPDCEAAAYAECGGDGVAAALAAGTASLVGEAACLEALATLDCEEWRVALTTSPTPVPACAGVVRGQVADGAACRSDAECSSGRCEVGASCPGTCVALEPQPDVVGAPCGAATDDFAFCAAPLTCGEGDTCAAPGDLEAVCDDATPCAPWLTCYAGTCGQYRAPGEPCFTTSQCDPRLPGPRLVCSGGVCTEGPGVGAPCTEFVCGSGYCDTAALPPTCLAAPGLGAACAGGGLCGDGLRCDGGACVAPLVDGSSCVSPAQCESYRCVGGTCLSPGAAPCPTVPPT